MKKNSSLFILIIFLSLTLGFLIGSNKNFLTNNSYFSKNNLSKFNLLINYLSNNSLCLKAILVTHKHHDHIGGIINIKERFPNIKVYGPLNPSFNFEYTDIHEGDSIKIEGTNLHFNVLETPGHTNDNIVYYNEENLFCGDTLFGCGCGRLFEGTAEEMFNSLQKLKMLKRHLKTAYNLSPDEYRKRWGLVPDYPMVAPNYAKHRSTLAKKIGLGTKPRNNKS